jgi:hypothetical protein
MTNFDDAVLPSLPFEGDFPFEARIKNQERTRRQAEGELTVHIDSLIHLLREKHDVDRIDRKLEFFDPELQLPIDITSDPIDSASVHLGQSTLETDPASPQPETQYDITIRLQAGDNAYIISRSSDPEIDPDEARDFVESPLPDSPDSVEVTTTPLSRDLTQAEVNAILFSLAAGYSVDTSDAIAQHNFLSSDNFINLYEVLDEKQTNKRVSFTYSFNDGLSELECTESDYIEYFELTHTVVDSINPRTLAISASSAGGTYMQYLQQNGTDIRVGKPQVSEVDILKNVVLKEISNIERESRIHNSKNPIGFVALNEGAIIVSRDAEITAIDLGIDTDAYFNASADALAVDDFPEGKPLDQDGFDSPDSSAA